MGRGNVCVTGKYEGLYYIDNDDFHVYVKSEDICADYQETALARELDFEEMTNGDYTYSSWESELELEDILNCFVDDFTRMFPKFERAQKDAYICKGEKHVLLESKLFYIVTEDNEWSVAIELIQKEEPYGAIWMENLQGIVHQKYLAGMKKCLLNRLPSIGTYSGAWTSGTVRQEDLFDW